MRRVHVFALVCLALGGCAGSEVSHATSTPSGARHTWTVPDVLRVSSSNAPRTLNPILATETIEASLDRLFSDVLVTADPRGRLVPDLAADVPTRANGGISADGRTVRYRLRRGVVWQDGAPFTSRDVRFTFEAIMNRRNDVISRRGYDLVDRVTTPDPYTIVFHFRTPFAPAVSTIFGESDSPYSIIPAHLLARYADLNSVPFNSAPIGTGPFRVVRWLHGDRVELARNDRYFLGRPKLRSIVMHFVGDENTEINQLRTHEIDWMFEATTAAYKALRAVPDTRVLLQPVNGYFGMLMNTARPPLDDVRVRRAIAMAIDKARLTHDVTGGAGETATEDLPSFTWAYDAHVARIPYDPLRASRLLAAAGYVRGSDGGLVRGGRRLSLDLAYEQSSYANRISAVQIQSALRGLGIEVSVRPLVSTVIYGGYAAGGTLSTGAYSLSLYLWFAGVDPDDSSQFLCATIPPGGYNQTRYCNPEMDAAQRDALSSFDSSRRAAAYAKVESLLARDVPVDFLFWQRNVQGLNPDFRGFDPNPVVETWDAYRWSI